MYVPKRGARTDDANLSRCLELVTTITVSTKLGVLIVNSLVGEKIATACAYGPNVFELRE